jgi:hypothetical protein
VTPFSRRASVQRARPCRSRQARRRAAEMRVAPYDVNCVHVRARIPSAESAAETSRAPGARRALRCSLPSGVSSLRIERPCANEASSPNDRSIASVTTFRASVGRRRRAASTWEARRCSAASTSARSSPSAAVRAAFSKRVSHPAMAETTNHRSGLIFEDEHGMGDGTHWLATRRRTCGRGSSWGRNLEQRDRRDRHPIPARRDA